MNINEVKDLMTQFDGSSLREFSWRTAEGELSFSKNENKILAAPTGTALPETKVSAPMPVSESSTELVEEVATVEGEAVTSPLVGVAYLQPAPGKPEFVSVGDSVKKGQTLLIIEAMKVMNEIPAPKDGVITEIMVNAEDVVEFGQELVRIK
ncbi:acetyl-CoA carboxylase biotin carboxyl carrier protein [Lactococcus petauri]|uniref:acetyl-CoA carboxylase biotin carboxyl carrier protein n=1 Tax=Lactococcus petauri TaxID=1940789 RepID=UPI00215B2BBA|nr:acetyl-CoA carboxylase biotin carboxyl carrier protein [Lactococcus petauri]MCR8688087.1 acetyl-CoA carboxylase biotin carboxyl carrier protein [Lactococcus petauri]